MKINIRSLFTFKRIAASSALCLLVIVSIVQPLKAQNVTQGYASDTPLQRGMIVAIKQGDATKIEPLSRDHIERMHGVVVDANDAPATLSEDGRKVFVAVTGTYAALVSNQNGTINIGDYISVSSINGVGMKADNRESIVLGKAIESFDGKGLIATQDVGGTKVALARVKVDLNVAKNPLARTEPSNLPSFLLKAGEAIAKKPVSTVRIYMSLAVLLISGFISGSLMVSGVRSSVIAIGRNPLSKAQIMKSLIQIILVSLIVFISGIFAVYLLLTL